MDNNQIVVRVTDKLHKAITKLAKEKGLTRASWVRLLIISTVDGAKNEPRK